MNWEQYQISDGLADFGLALNACRMGLRVKKNPAVSKCTVFKDLNHLATAGGGKKAIEDIINELSR